MCLSRILLVIFMCSSVVSTSAEDADFQCDILIATEQGITKYPVDTTTTPPLFGQPQPIPGVVGNCIAVAVDTLHGRIYWVNHDTAILHRANMDGSAQMSIANECDFRDIAVHSEEDKVYFTTYDERTVEVVNANGSGRTKLYEDGSNHLIGIAVDTRQSLVFFTTGGAKAVHKMNLDGSGHVKIVSGLGWPNGVAVDYKENRVCWSETPSRKIECADYDGGERRVLLKTPSPVYAIAIEDDFIYWTADVPPEVYSAERDRDDVHHLNVELMGSLALVRCKCPLLGRYVLSPPVKKEMSVRLNDADNGTCLALAHTPLYRFDASDHRWLPQPLDNCWMSGLVIEKCVPDAIKTSFSLTITGHHLVCSLSHFSVGVRKTKWSGCALAGEFNMCKWRDAVESGGLTTCEAACRCDGDDCNHVIIHFPKLHEEWQLCEINIK